jgi:hypothetical protein
MAKGTSIGRLLVAAVIAVSVAACGDSKDQVPTTPSTTPGTSNPVPPVPPTPTPPGGSGISLTGTVVEITPTGDRRPVAGLRLRVRAANAQAGAVGGVDLPDVVTDSSGRYEITGVSATVLFVSTAPGSSHRFMCDYFPLLAAFPYFIDLPVVSASWSGSDLPPGMWTMGTTVYGTVSERVGSTLRPVAAATVTLDGGSPDPPATTSAMGFYMVCSVMGMDQQRTVTASKAGYNPASRQFFGGTDLRVDLEIGR